MNLDYGFWYSAHMTITVRLADGTEHTYATASKPKFWKSWLLRQLPYGTDFYSIEIVSVTK